MSAICLFSTPSAVIWTPKDVDDGGQQFVGVIEVGADEGHVELDILKGELQDAHEVGVASPEVIERDRGALCHEHLDILLQARFV